MPPPAEEDELEYIDAQTELIPRQPIAPDPSLQRRRAHGVCVYIYVQLFIADYHPLQKRPYRGPPRPRNIVIPAPLNQAAAHFSTQSQQPYMVPQTESQQHGAYIPPLQNHEDDAPLHAAPTKDRRKRSHTQSSIGISVEPPVRRSSSSTPALLT
jgi:hypothetical protein